MKNFAISLVLVLIAVVFSGCTKDPEVTTGSITGVVTSSANGTSPLSGVNITILSSGKSATTGSNGQYSFKDLTPGSYTLQFTKAGYNTDSRSVTVVAGQSSSCDVQLKTETSKAIISINPSVLNFGTTQTQMSVEIQNNGTAETSWSLDLGNNNWLKANVTSGRIASKKQQTIVFTVDRTYLSATKSIIVNISASGSDFPITISCAPVNSKSEMSITPNVINFGTVSSEENLTIRNTGNNILNWKISGLNSSCLSVSEVKGAISAGGNKIVKVSLDRNKLYENLSTSFVVSDGISEQVVNVTAAKEIKVSKMVISPTSLNFSTNLTQQSISIRNQGTGDLKWTIQNISQSCITVSAKSGTVVAGGNTTIQVYLNRTTMPDNLNASFVITDGSSQQATITITGRKGKGILEVSPSSISFGETATSKSFVISNSGDGDLNWSISGISENCIKVSPSTGKIIPGGSTTVSVTLDRNSMTKDLNTSIAVSDGVSSKSISITGIRKVVEDYSSATITSCDSRIIAKITSCHRSGSSVVFTYQLINNIGDINDWRIYSPNSLGIISGGYRSVITDNLGNEYGYPRFTFRSKSAQGNNSIDVSFPSGVPCTGTVTITDVPSNATKITVMLGVYAYPDSYFNLADKRIWFKNVPIF